MSFAELYWAAMYISEIWYSGFKDEKNRGRFRLYCRARSIVIFDRIITGRVMAEPG